MPTPAMTARADLRAFYSRDNQRDANIKRRTTEIRNELVESENLLEMYAMDPEKALKRFDEIRVESRQQAMSEFPLTPLTDDEKKRKTRAHTMRGKVKNWNHRSNDLFDEQMSASIQAVQTEIAKGNELVTWFKTCIPSLAEFKESSAVSDAEVSGHYTSLMGQFGLIITCWQDIIDNYQEELEMHEAEPLSDIVAAIESLGLLQTFEDADDGYLWFTDPETSQLYFVSVVDKVIAVGGSGVSVLDSARLRGDVELIENWKSLWYVDLTHTAIVWQPGRIKPFARVAHTYFGLYDRLRPWIARSIEGGNTPPTFFPVELTTEN